MKKEISILIVISLIITLSQQQNTINLADNGVTGVALNSIGCNVQTIIDMNFNSSSSSTVSANTSQVVSHI